MLTHAHNYMHVVRYINAPWLVSKLAVIIVILLLFIISCVMGVFVCMCVCVIVDHFYIMLFSALKQTHCACM